MAEDDAGRGHESSSGGFEEFYSGLRALYPEEKEEFHYEDEGVDLEELTSLDLSLLFSRVRMFPDSLHTNFYRAFFEGIGFRDASEVASGVTRLSRIKWLEPQPEMQLEQIEADAKKAYKNFASYNDNVEPQLVVLTDINKVLELHETLNERDPNSYHKALPYRDRLFDLRYPAESVQEEKYKTGDPWKDSARVKPQNLVAYSLYSNICSAADRVLAEQELALQGTGEWLKRTIEQLPGILVSDALPIIEGFLAHEDAGTESNPYEPLIRMYEAGTIPLGGYDEDFYVYIPQLKPIGTDLISSTAINQ